MFDTRLSRDAILTLVDSLPPTTAVVTWCVLTDQVTTDVIDLADGAPDKEYSDYPLLGMVGGWNPDSLDGLRDMVLPMIEAMADYAVSQL